MDNANKHISGRVRSMEEAGIESGDNARKPSYDELFAKVKMMRGIIAEKDETIAQMGETIVQKDETIANQQKPSILGDAVRNSWSYDCLMENIDELQFEPKEYSIDFRETVPKSPTVGSTKTFENGQRQIDMSKFDYQTVSKPKRCGWKQVNLPDSFDRFICSSLFNNDPSVAESTAAKFAADLAMLRNVYCHYRQEKLTLRENDHFRPIFTLWLNKLVHSISTLSGWKVKVRQHVIEELEFSVFLNVDGEGAQEVRVLGHEDVVISTSNEKDIKIIGEYKVPFSAMYSPADALFHSALSQMYAEMQGFIVLRRPSAPAETTSTATAAQSDGDKPWNVSFLTDGFALRLSFASDELNTATQDLPTVYTSSDASVLEPLRFTETMLYMLAVIVSNDPHIDFAAASDFMVDENKSLPANDGPHGDESIGPGHNGEADHSRRSSSGRTRPSDRTVDDDDEEEDGGSSFLDWYEMAGDDDDLQFLQDEEEEVGRLNYLLESSSSKEVSLSKYALKTLGTRGVVL